MMKMFRHAMALVACAALLGCNGGDDDGSTTPTETPTTASTPTSTPENTVTTTPTETAMATATPSASPSPTTTMSVSVRFRARVGEGPFACETVYEGIGTTGAALTPADLRFFVSSVRLVTEDGDEVPVQLDQEYRPWQLDDLALLDFENKTGACFAFGTTQTNDVVVGTVPTAEYTGVRFVMGVPFELNHGNQATAPDPLSLESMFWSWQSGYKFLRIDTFEVSSSEEFRIHLGSTGCQSQSSSTPPSLCARPNRAEVELDDFNPHADVIVADLAALLADSNIESNTAGTPPGCMSDSSDPECDAVFANLGVSRVDGTSDPSQQSFFRVEKTVLEHAEIHIASTEEGGGQLTAELEFDGPVALFFNECIGGEGDHCEGGSILYTAANPGLSPVEEDDPENSRFTLPEGTPIRLEITALELTVAEAMIGFQLDDQRADAPGESILLGEVDFHADVSTQLVLPGGEHGGEELRASFRLTTESSQYQPSEDFTVRFVVLDEEGGHEHEDEGEEHEHEE